MAFDACMMRAVLTQLKEEFGSARIEKVLQPLGDEIVLLLHENRRTGRLVLNVGPNAPRLQLSDIAKENPDKPPMLCMLLRKHLTGARISSVEQPGFDRIARITLSCFDEMGYPTEKILIVEIMGKYNNLILLDSEEKIIAAHKVIDFAASTVRQVLPGLKYQIPEKPEKLSPLLIDTDAFRAAFSAFPKDRTLEKLITSAYSGIATQIAHELTYRISGNIDTRVGDIDENSALSVFTEWQKLLISESYTPTLVANSDGKPTDYSYMDITYLGDSASKRSFAKPSELLDAYFAERDRLEHIRVRAKDITTLVNNAVARTERKLGIQRTALLDAEAGDEYKHKADLITENIWRLRRGMQSFTATDYYTEGTPEVEIALDTRLSPADNAQKLYKQYNKCKTAKTVLAEQIRLWESELKYLESISDFIYRAECEDDLIELREELYRSGYASRMKGYKGVKKTRSKPKSYVTSGGYVLLVGRNNLENDQISHKLAERDDIWFHVKDIPGSHVLMRTDGEEPSELDYTEAARVAARFSKAHGDSIAVDYTKAKNLRKPQGAKPGFVTYKTNYTAFVSPMDDETLSKMERK